METGRSCRAAAPMSLFAHRFEKRAPPHYYLGVRRAFAVLFVSVLAFACAKGGLNDPHPLATRIVHGDTGQPVSYEELMAALSSADVVYIGERHDDETHHQIQERLLRALAAQHDDLGLGMEMFQTPFQEHIDSYLSDEIGEVAMLRRTEWYTRWGFPWTMYAPMVRFAREEQIPVVALNAPSELTKAVARRGLDGLTEEERSQLPEMDLNDAVHRQLVEEMLAHSHPLHGSQLDAFYAAQVLWDETMAERTVEFVRHEDYKRHMVVLAGIGHVAGGHGIPSRVERRMGGVGVTIIPSSRSAAGSHIAHRDADWLWITRERR